MDENWQNFLQNLGVWQGSFTSISVDGQVLDSTPSILELAGLENNQLVKFRLRRFPPGGYDEPPISDMVQEYRSLARQIVFFPTGAFSKGSIQLAPFSEFGAEYGFVAGDRRSRFVHLYDRDGNLSSLTLIREFRRDSPASERPPLTVEQLVGHWQGTAHTAYADWQPPETYPTNLQVSLNNGRLHQELSFAGHTIGSTARIDGNQLHFEDNSVPRRMLLLPDGTSSHVPLQLPRRTAFFVEVGWLVSATERQRLIRSYNDKGEWVSATHVIEHKCD